MIVKSNWTSAKAKSFMNSTKLGNYQVNVERRLRTKFGINTQAAEPPVDFTDWMVFATYVNNFQYSAEGAVCDGKTGRFFNQAYVKADTMDKVGFNQAYYGQGRGQKQNFWDIFPDFLCLLIEDELDPTFWIIVGSFQWQGNRGSCWVAALVLRHGGCVEKT